jgi:signal transduction histidine kinase
MGIHERMRHYRGSLEIMPSDNGTTVTAIIPFENQFRKAV